MGTRRLGLVASGLLVVVAGSGAAAHTPLVASSPSAGVRVEAAPTHVVLEFDRPVSADDDDVTVRDAAGELRGRDVLVSQSGRAVSVLLDPGGSAGTWSVRYGVRGEDGHVVAGGFEFAVAADPSGPPASWRPVAAGGVGAVAVMGAFVVMLRRLDRMDAT